MSLAAMERVPRATKWRRQKRQEKDKKVQKKGGTVHRQHDPVSYPCKLCDQPKRLKFGHSYYRGKSFCAKAAGWSVSDWLAEEKRATGQDQGRTMPKTTAWRLKKRLQQEKAGFMPKYRKRAPFAICHLCDQPRQKAYGHSRYKGIPFCSLHEGKTVELWLAEQRAADCEERPGTSVETAKQ